jgi:hypothetical protein
MKFTEFKIISEAQFNSKQEVIDHFVKQGKSAAAGASAWERGWRGHTPKKKELKPPPRSYHDDLDDKRYGETNEGWREEADDMSEWAEYVRTRLLKTPVPQRYSVAQQLSQIEVRNFGSSLISSHNYDPKTGHATGGRESGMTQIVYQTYNALKKPQGTLHAGHTSLTPEPQDIDKPDDNNGRDLVISTQMGWLSIPGAGQAPARVQRLLIKAFHWGPEIYPYALEIFQETGDFTEQDLQDLRIHAAERQRGERLESIEQELAEATLGTAPKRPARKGSRPDRGHEAQPRYKKIDYCDACDRPKAECVCDDEQLDEHKKGVRAHKYTKKPKGTIESNKKYMNSPDRKVIGPQKIVQLEKELKEAAEIMEGAKVDRMVKHIAKSERKLGKSKDEAEDIAWATANKRGFLDNKNKKKKVKESQNVCEFCGSSEHTSLDESGKASRSLCTSSKPDADLGASQLASCKAQGLRARQGEKSHKIGKSRVKVGGHKIKGRKYGGPLPDWS